MCDVWCGIFSMVLHNLFDGLICIWCVLYLFYFPHFSTVYLFFSSFIDTCDHEQKKIKIFKSMWPKNIFIELYVPIHIGMLISVYSNSNCKAKCTVFLMSIGNNMYTIHVHSHLLASKWLNSNRTNIGIVNLFFFSLFSSPFKRE